MSCRACPGLLAGKCLVYFVPFFECFGVGIGNYQSLMLFVEKDVVALADALRLELVAQDQILLEFSLLIAEETSGGGLADEPFAVLFGFVDVFDFVYEAGFVDPDAYSSVFVVLKKGVIMIDFG